MTTLLIIIALSFSVISLTLFTLTAIYWLPVWREQQAGLAHCLFWTNILLALISLMKFIQIVLFLLSNNGIGGGPFNLVVGLIVFFVSVVQFALSRGYFNVRE